MSGSIGNGTLSYSFEQLTEQLDPNQQLHFNPSIIQFVQTWFSSQEHFELHTSGSTGTPKEIRIPRKHIKNSAETTLRRLNLQAGNKALLCINPDYIGGKMMVARSIIGQLNLTVVEATADPSLLLLEDKEFDFAAMVPLQVETLLNSDRGKRLLNSIRKIIIGGATVSDELVEKLQNIESDIFSTYGMTETVSHIALKKLNGKHKTDSFQLLDGVESKLDDRGCLCIKAPVTNSQWITTNDIVELDDQGSFKWIGRIDNVINTGGIKVQIEVLEGLVKCIFPKLIFMVTSKPDSALGESVTMLTENKNLTKSERALLRQRLPEYHCPKYFIEVDKLPLTGSGKPDRKKAKDLAIL